MLLAQHKGELPFGDLSSLGVLPVIQCALLGQGRLRRGHFDF